MRTLKASILAALVAWSMLLTACTVNQLQAFKNSSTLVLSSAKGVDATLTNLIAQGKITGDFAKWIQTKLPPGIQFVTDLNGQIQALTSFPPTNKQALIDLLTTAITFIESAQAEGILKFGNSQIVSSVTTALAIIVGVLSTLKATLDGQPVTPAALQQMKDAPSKLDEINQELQTF